MSLNGGTIAPITAAAAAAALMPGRLVRHACMPCSVCARARAGMAVGIDGGDAVGAAHTWQSVGSALGDRACASSPHWLMCASSLCPRCACRCHDVGESDRPNRLYSGMNCIFCEYLRPFEAARGAAQARRRQGHGPPRPRAIAGRVAEGAAARACTRRARGRVACETASGAARWRHHRGQVAPGPHSPHQRNGVGGM